MILRISFRKGRSVSGLISQHTRRAGLVVFAGLIWLGLASSCSTGPERRLDRALATDNEVLVFGRTSCPFCHGFMEQLEADGIGYEFLDIDQEEQRAQLWELASAAYPELRNLSLPVVVVNDQVLIRPPYQEFLDQLRYADGSR